MKLKDRYIHELPKWTKLFGLKRIVDGKIEFTWGYFVPKFAFEFILHRGGYFDQHYAISIAPGWSKLHFKLPFKTKLKEGCDLPQYGIAIHDKTFWIYIGGEYDEDWGQCQNSWIAWDLPFVSYTFDGHWIQDKNREWVKMDRGMGVDFIQFREEYAYTETHPYTYTLRSGEIQNRTAKCTVEMRKWHRKWFPFLKKESKVIDIEFSDKVGERTGSWKGGCTACSYEMLPLESISEALKRMERERKF